MGETEKKEQENLVKVVVGAVIGVLFLWYFFGGGIEKQTADSMQQIHNQVTADVVQQYEIAKRSGTAMDAYVHAGIVSAAYLQAKDEANYQKWKAIEKQEAKRAGMP